MWLDFYEIYHIKIAEKVTAISKLVGHKIRSLPLTII